MEQPSHILPEILAKNLAEIHLLCRRHKVKRLWAFGSVLREEFGPESDVDLLYEWDRPQIKDEDFLNNIDTLLDSLRFLLGRKIDFVHYPSLKNPYFIEDVENTKVLLYAPKPEEILV